MNSIRLVSRIAVPVIVALLCSSPALATCGGGGGGGGGTQETYTPSWTSAHQAKEQAKVSLYGIVYYFPPNDTADIHSVFSTKVLADQSRQSPMVLVDKDDRKELRAKWKLDARHPTLVVTDANGNKMEIMASKGGLKAKLDVERIVAMVKQAPDFTKKLSKKAAERLKAANEKNEKKDYAGAVKELAFFQDVEGLPECEQATVLLQSLEEVGLEQVHAAKVESVTQPEEATKKLKKIASDFKGTAVEKAAQELLAELKKTAYVPPDATPAGESDYDAFCREAIELVPLDPAALARAFEVQGLVVAGAELERIHHYEEAERCYGAAHELDPADPVPLRFLGEFHRHHTGRWDVARRCFDEILALGSADAYSRAIALHGIGKMTINSGEYEKGLAFLEKSVSTFPTQLAYRNLAVYWNSEKSAEQKTREYVERAVALDPADPYTRVFEAVHIAAGGDPERALAQIDATPFDPSMYYNVACVYSTLRDRERTIEHLRRHFYEYETTDLVRAREMLEARSDVLFQWLFEDPEFVSLTALAAKRG